MPGIMGISAKLFCKHSQVTFLPYRVVLKDERPTSNAQRPTSNKIKNKNYKAKNQHGCPLWFLEAVQQSL
jgi:hypothetical protein